MCNVQLSDSALERLVAKRTFPYHRRTAVCRNLFGPVDHEELSRDLQCKLREIREECSQKWDFDFQKDAPLPKGTRYLWEETSAGSVPAFYREKLGSTDLVQSRLSQEQGDPKPAQETSGDSQEAASAEPALPTKPEAARRCRITDFSPVRKKARDGKALCSKACLESSIPTEQTPQKRLR
ncbi:cyclin-dependent kinase inhibitor 1C [Bombina bombina]|uniref:cyclin-dependent kinase inhibitor 1C n=1 Tax=Bombina bombina TaxID=8345 RepID=UPI00235B1926|nr:cyclin-dependent kinase inhibitor 1C [Bombina bombina]